MSRRPLRAELVELVGQQARRVVAAARDPRAKALRRRRRARRATVFRSGVALVAGTVTALISPDGGELELAGLAAGSVTAIAVLGAGAAGVRLVRLYRQPLPPPPAPPAAALPPSGSAAHEPMVRLVAAEASLADLLTVLARPRHGIPAVPPEVLETTRMAFAKTSAELRDTAEALRAVERAAAGDTGTDLAGGGRTGLVEAVDALRHQLDEGVDGVCRLVAAAGEVVTAAGSEYRPAALAEATDRLIGFAAGLRELPPRV